VSDPRVESAAARNARTIRAYESSASQYAESTAVEAGRPPGAHLQRLIDVLPADGTVLEIGSGPGWEADLLEARGVHVRRTDATESFLELQRRRGAEAERLDVIRDELCGPYDAIMALCVLQHVDRSLVPGVLSKISAAIRPRGAFLASVRDGRGEAWEGEYHTVLWDKTSFSEALRSAGLDTAGVDRTVEPEGPWLTFLATRVG
jgi:SAM-dependent methyltransferase